MCPEGAADWILGKAAKQSRLDGSIALPVRWEAFALRARARFVAGRGRRNGPQRVLAHTSL